MAESAQLANKIGEAYTGCHVGHKGIRTSLKSGTASLHAMKQRADGDAVNVAEANIKEKSNRSSTSSTAIQWLYYFRI